MQLPGEPQLGLCDVVGMVDAVAHVGSVASVLGLMTASRTTWQPTAVGVSNGGEPSACSG
jgi:hypothetical protein